MQLLQSPTRLAFAPAEMNAARRALFRLVSDFGADIRPEQNEWIIQLGGESAHITLDTQAETITLATGAGAATDTCLACAAAPQAEHLSIVLRALNAAGAKLLEVLCNSLKLEWRDPAKGPTHLRRQVSRAQMSTIAHILAVLK